MHLVQYYDNLIRYERWLAPAVYSASCGPGPIWHVFLCTLQVCLRARQTKMTIVNDLFEWLLLSAACRPWDGSSTCADDSPSHWADSGTAQCL